MQVTSTLVSQQIQSRSVGGGIDQPPPQARSVGGGIDQPPPSAQSVGGGIDQPPPGTGSNENGSISIKV